jgi:uncharacterized protein (DUF58 family)
MVTRSRLTDRFTDWLETHWLNPAYSGWVLGGLSLFFFIAATNTLAGWLYVLSGSGMAIILVSSYLARRSFQGIGVEHLKVDPVSAGDELLITLRFQNQTPEPKVLLEAIDCLPMMLGEPVRGTVALIPARSHWDWEYRYTAHHRGIYRWHTVDLRTAAPLGLFWYRQSFTTPVKAIVYPTVFPLSHCPIIDQMGKAQHPRVENDASTFNRPQQMMTEITRTLRPYRWGDPMRFIHWHTSARYGELRVRELEVFQGGQALLIALDSSFQWRDKQDFPLPLDPLQRVHSFEQAVAAAASLYFYAQNLHIPVKLWTAAQGVIAGQYAVLEALAATQPGEEKSHELPLEDAVLWLSQDPRSTHTLPSGSRWLLWTEPTGALTQGVGRYIYGGEMAETTLQEQLQEQFSTAL